ncbi:MAG: polysaccharide biosynthesis/export family protein [Dysgonamonadaceae bacterium]|nr:polysaccharide biosynthesis/export family protein [Dysgonamonadaceae bacterium]
MRKCVFLLIVCGFAMTSCLSPKIVYLEDMKPDYLYSLVEKTELRIQQDDRLRIIISSKNPELSAPFNLGVVGYRVSTEGELQTMDNPVTQEIGYVVSRQGTIEFPILGTLYVKGLTQQALSSLIKARLKEEELINDAIVTVELMNLKILMMGEVGGIGVLSVPDSRITLIEAIIRAGGLTANASLGEVAVIREIEGRRVMLMNDLRTVNVFNSSSFYLQQNDIVYVKPKSGMPSQRENRAWQMYSTLLGVASVIVSLSILMRTL